MLIKECHLHLHFNMSCDASYEVNDGINMTVNPNAQHEVTETYDCTEGYLGVFQDETEILRIKGQSSSKKDKEGRNVNGWFSLSRRSNTKSSNYGTTSEKWMENGNGYFQPFPMQRFGSPSNW